MAFASSSAGNNAAADSNNANNPQDEVLALPPVDPNNNDGTIPTIRLGETIRFEEWGPIILNTDGTTRRIANWDTLTEQEKKVTWRRISKRNEERRLALLEQMKEEETETDKNNNAEL